jgi:hypothetical protein
MAIQGVFTKILSGNDLYGTILVGKLYTRKGHWRTAALAARPPIMLCKKLRRFTFSLTPVRWSR